MVRLREVLPLLVISSLSGQAFAADAAVGPAAPASAPTEDKNLDEVVVTAEKRESTVQQTAISMSALSAESLQNQGISSIDPSLHPGFYADQYEYNTFDLEAVQLPAFVALAFPGPVDILNSTANVAGYIAFGATCPAGSEEQTLESAPWGGSYNTLQFAGSQYCGP